MLLEERKSRMGRIKASGDRFESIPGRRGKHEPVLCFPAKESFFAPRLLVGECSRQRAEPM